MSELFPNANWIHATSSALVSLGGFQTAPSWWIALSEYPIFQILTLTNFIFQGGGKLDLTFSLVIAVLTYVVVHMTKFITIQKTEDSDTSSTISATTSEKETVETTAVVEKPVEKVVVEEPAEQETKTTSVSVQNSSTPENAEPFFNNVTGILSDTNNYSLL